MQKDKKEYFRLLAALSSIGIEMGVNVIVGVFFGVYLDKYFNTGNILTAVFTMLGIVSAFRVLYIAAKKIERNMQKNKAGENGEKNINNDEA